MFPGWLAQEAGAPSSRTGAPIGDDRILGGNGASENMKNACFPLIRWLCMISSLYHPSHILTFRRGLNGRELARTRSSKRDKQIRRLMRRIRNAWRRRKSIDGRSSFPHQRIRRNPEMRTRTLRKGACESQRRISLNHSSIHFSSEKGVKPRRVKFILAPAFAKTPGHKTCNRGKGSSGPPWCLTTARMAIGRTMLKSGTAKTVRRRCLSWVKLPLVETKS